MSNKLEMKMVAIVSLTCDDLTDLELAAINNAAQFETDPRHVMGYEKAKDLFTEDGGTKMHEATRNALAAIVMERLG